MDAPIEFGFKITLTERADDTEIVPLTVRGFVPEAHPRRVLLCNPPVYDTRSSWARWSRHPAESAEE